MLKIIRGGTSRGPNKRNKKYRKRSARLRNGGAFLFQSREDCSSNCFREGRGAAEKCERMYREGGVAYLRRKGSRQS